MYKASELRSKSREELLKLISELKGKLLALRFESATGQLTETHLPSVTKKDIALIFTVLKEKELGIEIKSKEVKKQTSKPVIKKEEVKPTPKPVAKKPATPKKEVAKPTPKPVAKKPATPKKEVAKPTPKPVAKKPATPKKEVAKPTPKPVAKKPATPKKEVFKDHATIIIDGLVNEGKDDLISVESHSSTIDNTNHHIEKEKDVK